MSGILVQKAWTIYLQCLVQKAWTIFYMQSDFIQRFPGFGVRGPHSVVQNGPPL
jgi:hypothetical protein